ncbi:hypothetical protein HYV87_02685 [Candidatus Woesearchaeota archaeon]|nr:hypothetical protein [Candidatus Woesearchaeota archaeon]
MDRKNDLIEKVRLPSTELSVIMEELGRGGEFLTFPSTQAYYKASKRRDIEEIIAHDINRDGKFGQIEWYLRPGVNEEGKKKIRHIWIDYILEPNRSLGGLSFDVSERGDQILIRCYAQDVEVLESKISNIIKDIGFVNYEEDMGE